MAAKTRLAMGTAVRSVWVRHPLPSTTHLRAEGPQKTSEQNGAYCPAYSMGVAALSFAAAAPSRSPPLFLRLASVPLAFASFRTPLPFLSACGAARLLLPQFSSKTKLKAQKREEERREHEHQAALAVAVAAAKMRSVHFEHVGMSYKAWHGEVLGGSRPHDIRYSAVGYIV